MLKQFGILGRSKVVLGCFNPTKSIFSRSIHCLGCGNDTGSEVYSEVPLESRTQPESVNLAFEKKLHTDLFPKMSNEQLQELNWEFKPSEHILKYDLQVDAAKAKIKRIKDLKVCKDCELYRNGSLNSIKIPLEHPDESYNEDSCVKFYVIDALDFPLGVPDYDLATSNPKIFAKKHRNDVFVVNRCDLLVSHLSQLQKLKKYFMGTFFNKKGIKETKVILTSALRGWNLKKLSESFAKNKEISNVFIGPTNSGKTRLVHELSGVYSIKRVGVLSWPLPFTTQKPTQYTSSSSLRSKPLIDTPSTIEDVEHPGNGLEILRPNLLRKVCNGFKMIEKSAKYTAPKALGKTGQFISIGGVLVVEFPPIPDKKLAYHVFCNIGGFHHTDYLQAFSSMDKVNNMNVSSDPNHVKMRVHERTDLQLTKRLSFEPVLPTGERQSLVIKGMGFLQPFLFGNYPPYYTVNVYAADGLKIDVRKEILPHLLKPKKQHTKSEVKK